MSDHSINPIIKYVGIGVITVACLAGLRSCLSSSSSDVSINAPSSGQSGGGTELGSAAEEIRTLGVRIQDIDNKNKQAVEKLIKDLKDDNKEKEEKLSSLQQKVAELESSGSQGSGQVSPPIDVEQVTEDVAARLEKKVNEAINTIQNQADHSLNRRDKPSKNPLDDPNSNEYEVGGGQPQPLVWSAPLDSPELVDKGLIVVEKLKESIATAGTTISHQASESAENISDKVQSLPVFTIPANTTLFNAKTAGRILGRIAKGGTVANPFGFKVVVPGDSITANGHSINEVSHAFMAGYSVGDLGLTCAKAYITNMTFVFDDGRISQIGNSDTYGGGDKQVLAVVTDLANTECIPGELKTNLTEFATASMGLSALNAAAQGAIASQTTTITSGESTQSAPTGDKALIIGGNAIGGGVETGTQWLEERWDQTFDAILVEIGVDVQIETKMPIEIDYDSSSRKVKHFTQQEAIERLGDVDGWR